MGKKSEREMLAFRARQAARNKHAVPVDSIMLKKHFVPSLDEAEL